MLTVLGIVVAVAVLYAWYFHDKKATFWRRLGELTRHGAPIVYGEDQARGTILFGTSHAYSQFKYHSSEYPGYGRIKLAFQETIVVRRRAKQEAMTVMIEELTGVSRKYWINQYDDAVSKIFSRADDLSVWYGSDSDYFSVNSCWPFLDHVRYGLGQSADTAA